MKLYAYAAALLAVIAAGWFGYRHVYQRGYSAAEAVYEARSLQVQAEAHDRALARDIANQKAAQIAENNYALAIASNADLSHRLDDSLRAYAALRSRRVPEGSGAPDLAAQGPASPADDSQLAGMVSGALAACLSDSSQLSALIEWVSATRAIQ